MVKQLCLIHDHEGINLRPRILPILDLCARLHADAERIESELGILAQENPVCRRFMGVPGVGAITALSFFTAIEEPSRFRRADDVAAYLGLTPRIYQSGDTLTRGSISKMGNRLTRTHLVNAATVLMAGTKTFSSLKDWGLRLVKKIGFHKARIAVARKLAVVLFGLWRDGTHFQFKAETVVAHREMMQAARA